MKLAEQGVLSINGGSSSIKFALYEAGIRPVWVLGGYIERIGLSGTTFAFSDMTGRKGSAAVAAADHRAAVDFLIDWLDEQADFGSIVAAGHRVVHGMQHTLPERITPALLDELNRIRPYDPEHLPCEIEIIEALQRHSPALPQVACFDTSFHRSMPRVASLLPIPRRYDAQGVRRYGFHGLSYAYLMEELARTAGPEAANGRVILAHLGNGASMAAVHEGRSVDTTMGFTPAGGLVMGSRTGDLDPGVAWHLTENEHMTPEAFNHLVNHASGLVGISETSSDMRDLLARQETDTRAAEAVAVFCYQARKWIGAFAAALGGLDTLVFAGGIGEHAGEVRARICGDLGFLGIAIDEEQNAADAPVISAQTSRVAVRVMHTDEQAMIARMVCRELGLPFTKGA